MEDHVGGHLLMTPMVVRDMGVEDQRTASIIVALAIRLVAVQAFTRGVYQFLFECCLFAYYKPDESSNSSFHNSTSGGQFGDTPSFHGRYGSNFYSTLSLAIHINFLMNHHFTAIITAAVTIRPVTMRAFLPGVYINFPAHMLMCSLCIPAK